MFPLLSNYSTYTTANPFIYDAYIAFTPKSGAKT